MSDKVLATMTREEAQALSEKIAQLHPGLEWEVAQERCDGMTDAEWVGRRVIWRHPDGDSTGVVVRVERRGERLCCFVLDGAGHEWFAVTELLEVGQMTDYARVQEAVRKLALMELGWFESWARSTLIRYQMGGPVPQVAIDEACKVIVWCAERGVAAPSVYPTLLHDASSGVSLEWDVPSVWAEWMAPGVWELIAHVPCEFVATTEEVCAVLVAKEVSDDTAR